MAHVWNLICFHVRVPRCTDLSRTLSTCFFVGGFLEIFTSGRRCCFIASLSSFVQFVRSRAFLAELPATIRFHVFRMTCAQHYVGCLFLLLWINTCTVSWLCQLKTENWAFCSAFEADYINITTKLWISIGPCNYTKDWSSWFMWVSKTTQIRQCRWKMVKLLHQL